MKNPRSLLLVLLLSLTAATLILDRIIFKNVIFSFENHTGWDSFRWYNFEYHLQRLEAKRSKDTSDRPFIVITGSSIAKYSVQRELLKEKIEESLGRDVDVEMVVHAAMLPSDSASYMKRIVKLHPDLIVFITNPADLDMERYTPPWEAGPDYSSEAAFDYLKGRIPVSLYYPGEFALRYGSLLSSDRYFGLVFREALYSLRFREQWWDALEFNISMQRAKPVKSYLNYQGIPVGGETWRDGFSGSCLYFPADAVQNDHRFYFQVPEEMASVKDYKIEFYYIPAEHRIPPEERDTFINGCETPDYSEKIKEISPEEIGWQSTDLSDPSREGENGQIFVLLSHVVAENGNILESGKGAKIYRGRGIRLPGNFGLNEAPVDDYLVRRRTLEDVLLSEISDKEYYARFRSRVDPDDWREPRRMAVRQLNNLRLGKYYSNWYTFSDDIVQARYMKEAYQENSGDTPVLIINNPENPLTLGAYDGNDWYRGYLDFLQSFTEETSGRIRFADLHATGEMRMFVDAHHFSYDGMTSMSSVYGWLISESLKGQ